MTLDSYYFGSITDVYPPDHALNVSKYQCEYQVYLTIDLYAQIPVACIREDRFGSRDDFEDIILEVGTKVLVKFLRGERSIGIIQHSTRSYVAPQNPALGKHWRNRFNQVVRYIDKDGNYSVTSDQGPNLQVNIDKIVLDDSVGEQVILDKTKKTLFINANDFILDIKGNVQMNVDKNSTISITGDSSVSVHGNAQVIVTGDCSVSAKNIQATAQESAKVSCKELEATASGNAKITAAQIQLNGSSGDILTTTTMEVVDSIFGEPSIGVPTVKAG